MEMLYLIKKNGSFYAHHSAGYTARPECAEIYTKKEALAHANAHSEAYDKIRAVALNEVIRNANQLIPYLERMQKMVDVLTANDPTGE
jgi:hypothetical protein